MDIRDASKGGLGVPKAIEFRSSQTWSWQSVQKVQTRQFKLNAVVSAE